MLSEHRQAAAFGAYLRLVAQLHDLSEPCGSMLRRHFLDGLTPQEIADSEQIALVTVQIRIRRGLQILQARLDIDYDGDSPAWVLGLTDLLKPAWAARAGTSPANVRAVRYGLLGVAIAGLLLLGLVSNSFSPSDRNAVILAADSKADHLSDPLQAGERRPADLELLVGVVQNLSTGIPVIPKDGDQMRAPGSIDSAQLQSSEAVYTESSVANSGAGAVDVGGNSDLAGAADRASGNRTRNGFYAFPNRSYRHRAGGSSGVSQTSSGDAGNLSIGYLGADDVFRFADSGNFAASESSLSLSSGGTVVFSLQAGIENANADHWIIGSASGTYPGLDYAGGQHVPLNFDPMFAMTLNRPFAAPFGNFRGFLDPNGNGLATFTLSPRSDPLLAGFRIHFAYVAAQVPGSVDFASSAIFIDLLP